MTLRRTILLGMSAVLGAAGAGNAADYSPIYGNLLTTAPELTPVEIGTGWYIRGDATYDFDQDYDGSAEFSSPAGAVSFEQRDLNLDDGFGGGLGFGYRFSEYLRGDLTARYGRSDTEGFVDLSGNCGVLGAICDVTAESEARSWELMANAYVDLGTFAGFTPYVGGGVGAVNLSYEDVDSSFCSSEFDGAGVPGCGSLGLDGDESWRFAYALNAGLAYNVSRNLTLDVGYRYLDVEGGSMYGGSLETAGLDETSLSTDDDGFERHTITAGIRYSLW